MKRRWYFRRILEYNFKERAGKMKKQIFVAWKKILKKKSTLKKLAFQFSKERKIHIKKRYLYVNEFSL